MLHRTSHDFWRHFHFTPPAFQSMSSAFFAIWQRRSATPRFFRKAFGRGKRCLGCCFIGNMVRVIAMGNCYVEHFAVNPALRGRSIGSGILSSFCARHPLSVLEIDPLADEVSVRRKGFYERLGFCLNPYEHRHPPYRVGNAPHPLLVMSWPRVLKQTEYSEFTEFLSHRVMRYSLGNTGKTAEK